MYSLYRSNIGNQSFRIKSNRTNKVFSCVNLKTCFTSNNKSSYLVRRKIRNRKYCCSNLHFGICSIDLKGSKTWHPIHEIVFNFVPLAESREMGRELGDRITNFNGFWPIAIKWPIDHKISIKTSYRPALDPSENGTPNTRSRAPIPVVGSDRRV